MAPATSRLNLSSGDPKKLERVGGPGWVVRSDSRTLTALALVVFVDCILQETLSILCVVLDSQCLSLPTLWLYLLHPWGLWLQPLTAHSCQSAQTASHPRNQGR